MHSLLPSHCLKDFVKIVGAGHTQDHRDIVGGTLRKNKKNRTYSVALAAGYGFLSEGAGWVRGNEHVGPVGLISLARSSGFVVCN